MDERKPDPDHRRGFVEETGAWRQFSYFVLGAVVFSLLATLSSGTAMRVVWWSIFGISVAGAVVYFCRAIKR